MSDPQQPIEMSYSELEKLITETLKEQEQEIQYTETLKEISIEDLKMMISSIARQSAWAKTAERLDMDINLLNEYRSK